VGKNINSKNVLNS